MTKRVALSGDLIHSRETEGRARLATRLRATFGALARRFTFLAPPVLTRGIDEFSAVLAAPDQAFAFLVALNEAAWPHRFRMGVGVGTIDVAGRTKDAARMDGPAFHGAAEALARARASGRTFTVVAAGAAPGDVEAIEAMALAHDTFVAGWSSAVARSIRALREHETGQAAGDAIGVSQQAISAARRRGQYDTLLVLEGAIAGLLAARIPMSTAASEHA